MELAGALINGVGIILGAAVGIVGRRRLGTRFRDLALKAIGLAVVVVGIHMTQSLAEPANLLLSLVIGAGLGESWHVESGLERFGMWAETALGRGNFSRGFVPATLIFDVGALAILGGIQAGSGHPPTILLTKSVLDGVTAMVLAATLGWGVMGAGLVTVLYEGFITIGAHQASGWLPPAILGEFSAVGGILVAAIGFNFVLERPVISVGNLLPALLVAIVLGWLGIGLHLTYL